MFTRLIVSENRLGVNTKKRVENRWRITRADIRPSVYWALRVFILSRSSIND